MNVQFSCEVATMSINHIQFQRGMSFAQFIERFGTEAQCEEALAAARWPSGWRCAHCDGSRFFHTHSNTARKLWECFLCGYQSSSLVGTVFEHTKLGLKSWFLAMFLMTQSKNAVSALELKRQLGVNYKTAWLVKHKLLRVMELRDEPRKLGGRVEIDDAYLGGEREGNINGGRGALNKSAFVAAVQTTAQGKPLFARLKLISGFTIEAFKDWASENLQSGAHVVSDGTACFRYVTDIGATHERYVTGCGRVAAKHASFRWVNTMLGNLKTAISGTYHSINHSKYGNRYLAEFSYRFNRRFDLASMLPRLLNAAATTKPHTLRTLRSSEAGG
jgi:transposase-like protein